MANNAEVTIEAADILPGNFRNFSGDPTKPFNKAGKRYFNVALEEELAKQMELDGWNVKWLDPREDEDVARAILRVEVRFDPIPPRIRMISGNTQTNLDEHMVTMLDHAITRDANVDVVISGSYWDVDGNQGIKAYLRTMYVTLPQNDLDRKYADIPLSMPSAVEENLEEGTWGR